MKIFRELDRFYFLFGTVLLILSIVVIVSLRGVFSALSTSSEIDEALLDTSLPRVNIEKVNDGLGSLSNTEPIPLDLKR